MEVSPATLVLTGVGAPSFALIIGWILRDRRKARSDVDAQENTSAAAIVTAAISGYKEASTGERAAMSEYRVVVGQLATLEAGQASLKEEVRRLREEVDGTKRQLVEYKRKAVVLARIAWRRGVEIKDRDEVISSLATVMSAGRAGREEVQGALNKAIGILDHFTMTYKNSLPVPQPDAGRVDDEEVLEEILADPEVGQYMVDMEKGTS